MRKLFALIIILVLGSGCGVVAMDRIGREMELSKATYKKCLEQNQNDPSKCEALRRAYEADLQAYREAIIRGR